MRSPLDLSKLTLSKSALKEIKKARENGGDFSRPLCYSRGGKLVIQYRINCGRTAEIHVPNGSWSEK